MTHPAASSSPYSQLSGELLREAGTRRIPIAGSFELTSRCNLACEHCYLCGGEAASAKRNSAEPSTAQIRAWLAELAEAGCLWLALTGGEPLLRTDFVEIYRTAHELGFLITLLTNGTLLDEEALDLLAAAPPLAVEITLYGGTEATHDRVTGVRGSWRATWQTIHGLKQRGIRFRLKTTVICHNQHEIALMREQANRQGAGFRFDPLINIALDGREAPSALRIPAAAVTALEAGDPRVASAWRELISGRAGGDKASRRLGPCGAGLTHFHLDAQGDLSPCIMLREPAASLREMSFAVAWNTVLAEAQQQLASLRSACDTCALSAGCSHCPGWGWMERRDMSAPVDYLCQVARMRAESFLGDARGTWAEDV